MLLDALQFVGIGVTAGILSALLGVGGGVVIVPSLTFLFHFPILHAIASSLVCVVGSSLALVIGKLRAQQVDTRLGSLIENWALVGGVLGASLATQIDPQTVSRIFAVFLLVVASLMLSKAIWPEGFSKKRLAAEMPNDRSHYRLTSMIFGSGILSGLLGVGGGVLIVPALTIFGRVPMQIATGTSNYVMGLTACGSAFILFYQGNVQAEPTAFLVVGLWLGGWLGLRYFSKLKTSTLTYLFCILLVATSIKLLGKP